MTIIPKNYFGKQIDSISSILDMCCKYYGIYNFPDLDCMTCRPFSLQTPITKPQLWFSSSIDPWNGLLCALRIINIDFECVSFKKRALGNSEASFEEVDKVNLLNLIAKGLVILGPINPLTIWNRIQNNYFYGDGHFIAIIRNLNKNNLLLVHDPEGCPYFRISLDKLLAAIDYKQGNYGGILLKQFKGMKDYKTIYQEAFISCLAVRNEGNTIDINGSRGILNLSKKIFSEGLKSSEEGALYYSIPELQMSRWKMSCFMERYLIYLSKDIYCPNINTYNLRGVFNLYINECAQALTLLYQRNLIELSMSMKTIAEYEEEIDNVLSI